MLADYCYKILFGMTLALVFAGCSSSSSNRGAALAPGMTSEQAVQAMGQPDLQDVVKDPNSGASAKRYVWLNSGKVALIGSDNKVSSLQQIEPGEKTQEAVEEARTQDQEPRPFDPIATPLGYMFFPVRAGFTYLGAGLNCAAGGGCHKPKLPDPSNG
jgi:hypothetical protein